MEVDAACFDEDPFPMRVTGLRDAAPRKNRPFVGRRQEHCLP